MKRLYLFCVFVCISFNVNAQNTENPCNFQFSTEVVKCGDEVANHLRFATLKWDFTDVSTAQATTKIEIVPILDCWEEINGKQFRDMVTIDIDAAHLKGQTEITLRNLTAKCFKWRTVITSQGGCVTETIWKYHSFLPKRP